MLDYCQPSLYEIFQAENLHSAGFVETIFLKVLDHYESEEGRI